MKIMKKFLVLLSAAALLLAFTSCNFQKQISGKTDDKDKNTQIYVSAAASLKDALEEINANYEQETGISPVMNFAGSGKLVQQILEGAPADVFISASKAKMKELVEEGAVEESDISILLKNELVMISPKDEENGISSIQELISVDGKIAIGEVETVPAGTYAKEALENMGLWNQIQDRIVYAKDVRAVLSYVEQGEVIAGFVYKSDFVVSKNSKVLQVIDESYHKPIVYPVAVLKDSDKTEEANKYQNYLKTKKSMEIFEKYGFKTEVE